MEPNVENKLDICRKGSIKLGGFQLNATSHFNPTFEGQVELRIFLNSNLLDPAKHLAVVFEVKFGPNASVPLKGGDVES